MKGSIGLPNTGLQGGYTAEMAQYELKLQRKLNKLQNEKLQDNLSNLCQEDVDIQTEIWVLMIEEQGISGYRNHELLSKSCLEKIVNKLAHTLWANPRLFRTDPCGTKPEDCGTVMPNPYIEKDKYITTSTGNKICPVPYYRKENDKTYFMCDKCGKASRGSPTRIKKNPEMPADYQPYSEIHFGRVTKWALKRAFNPVKSMTTYGNLEPDDSRVMYLCQKCLNKVINEIFMN